MEFIIQGQTYHCATTLKVIYELQKVKGFKSFQESINSLSSLTVEDQVELIYIAYKCCKDNVQFLDKNNFIDMLYENLGIFKLTDLATKITDGLLFSGLSTEELEAKKAEIQKTSVGMNNSNMPAE